MNGGIIIMENKKCSIHGCSIEAPLDNYIVSVGLQKQYCDEHLKLYKEKTGK